MLNQGKQEPSTTGLSFQKPPIYLTILGWIEFHRPRSPLRCYVRCLLHYSRQIPLQRVLRCGRKRRRKNTVADCNFPRYKRLGMKLSEEMSPMLFPKSSNIFRTTAPQTTSPLEDWGGVIT